MDFGVIVPHIGFNSGPVALRDVAQAAEELGYASLWTADHVIIPDSYESPYPFSDDDKIGLGGDQPYYEMFTTMSYLAAVTTRVKLGTAAVVIPYRHPVLTAKMVSTIDQLSHGRVVLGVGVGWLDEEFKALGVSFSTRGAATDEALDLMRRAWSAEQPVDFSGSHFEVKQSWFQPRPYEGRHVPYWIGGASDVALRRTARIGDGWFPHLYGADPAWLQTSMQRIRDLRDGSGDDRPVQLALFVPIRVTDTDPDPSAGPAWEQKSLSGTPEYLASSLRMYRDAGVDHVALLLSGRTEQRVRMLERLRDEVFSSI